MQKLNNIYETDEMELRVALYMQNFFDIFYLNQGLQHIIDKAREVFGHPMLVHDISYKVLASSYDINDIIAFTEDENGNKYINEETINYIHSNYVLMKEIRKAGSYNLIKESDPLNGVLLSLIKTDGIEVAKLVIYEAGTQFSPIVIKLADRFSQLLSIELQKNNLFGRDKNLILNYMIEDLLEGKILDEETLRNKLHYLKWTKSQTFQIMIITNTGVGILGSKIPFVMGALKNFVQIDNCTVYKSNIIVFIDSRHYNNLFGKNSRFSDFLRANNLSAGISLKFSKISESRRFYSQAFKAVELGQRYGSHIAFFEDFRLSIISDYIISQFDLMDFCHPAVIQLINFDKQNGTNLLDTLKNYLYYTNSPNEAAKALCIHRNTLFYRINKIKDMTEISLNNAEEISTLYFSIRLLEINGRLL